MHVLVNPVDVQLPDQDRRNTPASTHAWNGLGYAVEDLIGRRRVDAAAERVLRELS